MFQFETLIAMNFRAFVTSSLFEFDFFKVPKTVLVGTLLEFWIFLNEEEEIMFFNFRFCFIRQFLVDLFLFI